MVLGTSASYGKYVVTSDVDIDLDRFFIDFGGQVGTKIHQKSIKNQLEIDPKTIKNLIIFLNAFWIEISPIFDGFGVPKSMKNQSIIDQKTKKKEKELNMSNLQKTLYFTMFL